MDLIDLLSGSQNRSLTAAGAQFGLSEEQTRSAFEALAPVIASGLRRNMASGDGLSALVGALSQGSHGRYLDDPDAVRFDNARQEGNGILGHVFGSPDVSRGVALQAAQNLGIGGDILKKMLPIIATMVLGGLAKSMFGGRGAAQTPQAPEPQSPGGLGDILGDILGGGARRAPTPQSQAPQNQAPQAPQMPGGLDDILRDVLGGGAGRSGQPGGGLGDILGEILGGGRGSPAPKQQRADPQEDPATRGRDILGDVLGRNTSRGNAADDLLASVERSLGRR
ncbi:MAG: DUF937 domain-containing protein [Parvibaculaceae bacterium]